MELSALGIPLEPVRYIWLIAFLLYLVVCVAVDIAYSSTMSKEEARRRFLQGLPRRQSDEVRRTPLPGRRPAPQT